MNSEFEMEVNNTEEAACYNCATQNHYCEFNAPSFDSFEPNGMFGSKESLLRVQCSKF